MSLSSSAPWMKVSRRPSIKSPTNPFDKATIVSILPKTIIERKVTLQPGIFEISPGTFDKPSILVVGPSSWWKDIDEQQPLLEIPTSAIVVADSVVKDYCNGYIGCDMSTKMPGLFYLPGEVNLNELKSKHKDKLERARVLQNAWFAELVKMADVLWSRSSGNPLSISDDMRLAVEQLNLASGKPWMQDFKTIQMQPCPACGHMKNPEFPICGNCKAVTDKKKAEELGLVFAKA